MTKFTYKDDDFMTKFTYEDDGDKKEATSNASTHHCKHRFLQDTVWPWRGLWWYEFLLYTPKVWRSTCGVDPVAIRMVIGQDKKLG